MIVNREELVMDGLSAGRVLGPLASYAAGFVVELVGRGYRPRSVSGQLELMVHLSRWLAEEGVELGGLTVEMADRFLGVRRESASSLRSWRALDRCRDTSVRGGHLIDAVVRPTLELIVADVPAHLRKRHDAQSGLALIAPEL